MYKVTNYDYYLGVDVSKRTLDISIITNENEMLHYEQIENTEKSIKIFITKLKKKHIDVFNKCLFCAEFTGIYSDPLQNVLTNLSIDLWLERPLQIKRTQGIVRGKTDKIDSLRIAQYANKYRNDIKLWLPLREEVKTLKKLVSLRNRLLKSKKQLEQIFKEQEFLSKEEQVLLKRACKKSLAALKLDIKTVELQMTQIIKDDIQLFKYYKIITSVDGIGMFTAIEIIITTNEFKNIKKSKKYACYSGVVPYDHSSGTSIRKRPRVSKMANTSVKTLLHMSALSVINMEGDLKNYYHRKVDEGKNKMSVLNAIRNKLILRVFACVNDNRVYQKIYNFSLG